MKVFLVVLEIFTGILGIMALFKGEWTQAAAYWAIHCALKIERVTVYAS